MTQQLTCDVLIIGSGVAGLTLALSLAENARIIITCKNLGLSSSSQYAQGGIAAVLDQYDSIDAHVSDTLIAGADLNNREAVYFTATKSKAAIQWLLALDIPFTRDTQHPTGLHLNQEGGHSQRRIVHVADKTGAEVVAKLVEQVQLHPNIICLTQHHAVDLILQDQKCSGAYFFDEQNKEIILIHAKTSILATGGASGVYLNTSNPEGNNGDGIAIAWRAGCRIANLEFNQFHPTCLAHPRSKSFLISEAVRGEGGKLLLPNGERFMQKHDPRGELAPRDIVARAIDFELKHQQIPHVYLDISHLPSAKIMQYFPTIYAYCLNLGIDICREPIPVVPAAHYTCGGVVTNLQAQTDIPCLYAIGEVAHTGLHGANRLASNSLLECLVFARAAASAIQEKLSTIFSKKSLQESEIPNLVFSLQHAEQAKALISNLRLMMTHYLGIVRSNEFLQNAKDQLKIIKTHSEPLLATPALNADLLELRNLIQVAELMIDCALLRKESRGLHYNLDYPAVSVVTQDSVLSPILTPSPDSITS